MIKQKYYFGFYWKSRFEKMETRAVKILKTIELLESIDKALGNWFEPRGNFEIAQNEIIPRSYDLFYEFCLKRTNPKKSKNFDYDNNVLTFELLSGTSKNDLISLMFSVGGNYKSSLIGNSCVLKLPAEGQLSKLLLQKNNIIKIISNLSSIWDCDYAILTSHEFNAKIQSGNEIGLFTYYKDSNELRSKLKNTSHHGVYIENVYVLELPYLT